MMPGRDPGSPEVAGGLVRHIPVLAPQVLDLLALPDGATVIDGTFGAGGYTGSLLQNPKTRVLAIDRDPAAIAAGRDLEARLQGRLTLVQGRFSELDEVAADQGLTEVDAVVLDVGVSSMQLDDPARGFSFRADGPLDMRMGEEGPTAADVIAAASERDLAAVIATLGEERHARAVARAIVKARQQAPIRTTGALADIVGRVVRTRPGDIHPATRSFQALRILVNDELGELAMALAASERILKSGGRLAVVAFHSLEDRIVKSFLGERSSTGGGSRHLPEVVRPAPSFTVITRRPVTPDEAETAANPRARSAKLRVAERTAAAPHRDGLDKFLPRLPSLADMLRGGR
jgi:16S rRNA (cytosine1402-N4)-methyltransferase